MPRTIVSIAFGSARSIERPAERPAASACERAIRSSRLFAE